MGFCRELKRFVTRLLISKKQNSTPIASMSFCKTFNMPKYPAKEHSRAFRHSLVMPMWSRWLFLVHVKKTEWKRATS